MPRPIVLDVDTGTDDALALLYAVGLARPRPAGRELRGRERRAGPGGRQHPQGARRRRSAGPARRGGGDQAVHRADAARGRVPRRGRSGGRPAAATARTRSDQSATEMLHDADHAGRTEPVTLVSLAPMTNVAMLLTLHPDVADHLERLVFMGGSAVDGQRDRGGGVQRLAGPGGGDLRGRVRAARDDVRAGRVQPPAHPAGRRRPLDAVGAPGGPGRRRAAAPTRNPRGRLRAGLRRRPRRRGRPRAPDAPASCSRPRRCPSGSTCRASVAGRPSSTGDPTRRTRRRSTATRGRSSRSPWTSTSMPRRPRSSRSSRYVDR